MDGGDCGYDWRLLLGRSSLLAVAEVHLAGSEALAAFAAEGCAGPRVHAGVPAVEAVGPAAAARALFSGVVFGVRAAGLESDEGWSAEIPDAVAPADGAPVSVVGHRGADALSAALDAASKTAMILHATNPMPVSFLRTALRFRLPPTALHGNGWHH